MASLRTWLAALAALLPAAVVAADLPAGAIARIGDYRFYHGPGFQCAVLSPDGRRAASAAGPLPFTHHVTDRDREEYGRTLILWDTATGDRLREMKVGEGPVRHLAFSPDGRVLAAVCSQGVTLFDPETGRLIRRFGDDFDDRARFTPDGKELLGGGFLKHTVSAWDVASGKRVRNWKSPAGPNEWVKDLEAVRHSEPSPDGRLIAWLLYNAPDYRRLPRGAHPSFPFTFPAHALVVTDAASGRPLYRREFGETALLAFTFSPDGRRFLTGGDKLQVWDATTGRELAALDCPGVFRAAVTQDGRRAVVAAYNARVRVWDLETGKPGPGLNAGLAGGSEPILEASPSISADGATVLLATDTTLRLFDLVTGQEPPGPAHRTP
ncbi:MAG TPA: PQQ-binding-like beta-propeller repeat protein, partial [Urbifossiella sp.]|nr:PQQ-binding-like beta-propeller repeat protein [Urbifossiella sp.]